MHTIFANIIIVIASLWASTFFSGWIIIWLFERILKSEQDSSVITAIRKSMNGVGKYIGWLERFLIMCFIFVNYFQGIGFILAAKSIFRFGEIKNDSDRRFAEYVIVGTLLSFAFAIVFGILMRYLLGLPIRDL